MSTKFKKTASSKRPNSLVAPVILIGLGLFLLLNNLGIINWNWWEAISRLWPIVLIALGLDLLIIRRSLFGSVLLTLITVVILASGFHLLNRVGVQGEFVSGEVSQSLEGAAHAEVEIGFSVGHLQLHALAPDTPLLVAGTIEHDERSTGRVEQAFEKRGDMAHYEITARGSSSSFPFDSQSQRNTWDLMLNRDVPLDLTARTGVGTSELDLSLLNLSNLSVTSGVGETTIIMPAQGQVTAVVSGGVGELVIHIPDGMAARIDARTGLGNTQIAGEFVRDDNVYTSPGYETAVDRLDLELRAGVGQVTVRRLTGR